MTWKLIGVEFVVSVWTIVTLGADILNLPRRNRLWLLALAGLSLAAIVLALQPPESLGESFQDMFVVDGFGRYFKGLFLVIAAVVIVMTREFEDRLSAPLGAFYMLLFTALLGMLIVASVNDLLLLFVGLELITFSLYIMTAYLKTDPRSVEAGMKYLIIGSIASGFLIYGVALLYGFSGSTHFPSLHKAIVSGVIPLSAQAGFFFVLAGLGFKIAAVPFHLWVPDVYEGAPTPVVAFLSVGSKMAGIIALVRILYGVFLPLHGLWMDTLAILSAATMLYGNLAAIVQTNIKRLLGYSSIGHAGYLLMALSSGSSLGVSAVGYYLLAYLVSNLTVFLVIVAASKTIGGDHLEAYNGLSKRSPALAGALFLGLLSLAGVPPLAGFSGKLLILLAGAQAGQLWLVTIGALNVALSLYYYLMIVKRMYLGTPINPSVIRVHPVTHTTLILLVLGIFVLGIFQNPFLQQIQSAIENQQWTRPQFPNAEPP